MYFYKKYGKTLCVPESNKERQKFKRLIQKSKSGRTYNIPNETINNLKDRDNGNYFSVYISPDDYLKITSSEALIKDIERETKKYGKLDLSKIDNGFMMLEIDLNNGKVVSHEGRHRMQLLKNSGYKKAQIIVISSNNSYDEKFGHDIKELSLKHQMRNENRTIIIRDLKIINKKK